MAAAYAELGQFDAARHALSEAFSTQEETGERWWEAEIHSVAGEIELKSLSPDTAKVEEYFNRALSVAQTQQARSWELRAAMSMARLWCDQRKLGDARALLAPIYDSFTEGFKTRDLKEAKMLLEELALYRERISGVSALVRAEGTTKTPSNKGEPHVLH